MAERGGDEMLDGEADKTKKLAKIRTPRAALEAKTKAEAEVKSAAEPLAKRRHGGRNPKTAPGTPPDKVQRNFSGPLPSRAS